MSAVPRSTGLLLIWALVLFTITVVVGILNGTDLVTFERNALLTHLHAGTLGWISLGILGTMLWVFDRGDADEWGGRGLTVWSVAAIVLYIVGFWTGNRVLRPIVGSAALIPSSAAWCGRHGAAGVPPGTFPGWGSSSVSFRSPSAVYSGSCSVCSEPA